MPKVSVLMPVYNGEKYIREAIESILSQSFLDFELIVVDDGSTDNTEIIINSYKDKRIRYIANSTNLGLAGARNRAIEVSNGEYLAWLDSDDVSIKDRLKKQVKLLDDQKKIGLCGTWVRTIGLNPERTWKYPNNPDYVRALMLFDNPVATSSILMRRSCLEIGKPSFDPQFPPAEDYDLWERVSRRSGITNIPEVLTLYRVHPNQISNIKREKQINSIWEIQSRLLHELRIQPNDKEKLLHLDIGVGWHFESNKEIINSTENWLLKLANANDKMNVFPKDGFYKVLANRWSFTIHSAISDGLETWSRFGKSELIKYDLVNLRRQTRLLYDQWKLNGLNLSDRKHLTLK